METKTAEANSQTKETQLGWASGKIHVLASNILSNLNSIDERLNRIYFLSKTEQESQNKADVAPDDGSFMYRMSQKITELELAEKRTLEILKHLDKIVG